MPTSDTPAPGGPQIHVIRGTAWQGEAARLKHVFLAGNLQRRVPHPFLRRDDVEIIACVYQPGDHGVPHWHPLVDELELVLDGVVSYREISSGELRRFEAGDFLSIPRGVCVERRVDQPARTIAIKLPSRDDKVECRHCDRVCASRREPFRTA
jgi:hypothetical protein